MNLVDPSYVPHFWEKFSSGHPRVVEKFPGKVGKFWYSLGWCSLVKLDSSSPNSGKNKKYFAPYFQENCTTPVEHTHFGNPPFAHYEEIPTYSLCWNNLKIISPFKPGRGSLCSWVNIPNIFKVLLSWWFSFSQGGICDVSSLGSLSSLTSPSGLAAQLGGDVIHPQLPCWMRCCPSLVTK